MEGEVSLYSERETAKDQIDGGNVKPHCEWG